MSNRKFYSILIFLIILICIVFCYLFICINSKNNKQSNENDEFYFLEYDKILSSDDTKVCTVNNEDITNRDIVLRKYLNHEKDEVLKDKTIQEKVILQKIKENNISLNNDANIYIKEIIQGLSDSEEINSKYSENEKKELLETLSVKLHNDALIEQFKADIIHKIAHRNFLPTDATVIEKYNICLDIQDKWDNNEDISYKKLTEAREAVYSAYINSLVSNSNIIE